MEIGGAVRELLDSSCRNRRANPTSKNETRSNLYSERKSWCLVTTGKSDRPLPGKKRGWLCEEVTKAKRIVDGIPLTAPIARKFRRTKLVHS